MRIAATGVQYTMTTEDEERAERHRQHGYEEKGSYGTIMPDLPVCAFCDGIAARCGHSSGLIFSPERGMRGWENYDRAIRCDTPFEVYCDGSGTVGDKPAGAGVVLVRAGVVLAEAAIGFEKGTNNFAECRAIHIAMLLLGSHVSQLGGRGYEALGTVYSDSEWALAATAPGCNWNLRAKKKDGTEQASTGAALAARALRAKMKRTDFCWLKGHAGHIYNERADELAGMARKRVVEIMHNKSKETNK